MPTTIPLVVNGLFKAGSTTSERPPSVVLEPPEPPPFSDFSAVFPLGLLAGAEVKFSVLEVSDSAFLEPKSEFSVATSSGFLVPSGCSADTEIVVPCV